MDSRFNEYFGFIQSDVDRILKDAEAENYAETMKNWYDGYHFGDFDVYCPWDVMNYLRDIQEQPGQKRPVIGKIPAIMRLSGRLLIMREIVLRIN